MAYYRKKQLQELVDWKPDFPMGLVSISEADKNNGSPKKGDKIAFNPKDPTDMWLVAKQFFEDNYEPVEEKRWREFVNKDTGWVWREWC